MLMGVGGFMMYEAYKNPSPAPITKALAVLNSGSTTGTTTAPAVTTNTAGQTIPEQLTQPAAAG